MNRSNRIGWVDAAKGVAIILVGVGHYGCPPLLKTWIYLFHMPLFFMMSGYTLNVDKYRFKDFAKRKAKAFLIPWAIGLIFLELFNDAILMLKGTFQGIPLVTIPQRLLVCIRIDYEGIFDPSYWFLPCLFVTELIFYFILKKMNHKNVFLIITICCVAIIYLYKLIGIYLPWSIDLVPIAGLFVSFGYFLKQYYSDNLNQLSRFKAFILGIPLLIVGLLMGLLNEKLTGQSCNMITAAYGDVALYVIVAMICSLGVIFICKSISNQYMNYVGQNSLYFYIAQPIAYRIADTLLVAMVPFYVSYLSNYRDFLVLHIVCNIIILAFVLSYNKMKKIIRKD